MSAESPPGSRCTAAQLPAKASPPRPRRAPAAASGIVQGKATVRAVERKTDFACFDIELPAERAENVAIGEAWQSSGGGGRLRLCNCILALTLRCTPQRTLSSRFTLPCPLPPPCGPPGASVAINGTCLTVTEQRGPVLRFDVMAETLRRTNLGALQAGSPVNFERRWAAPALAAWECRTAGCGTRRQPMGGPEAPCLPAALLCSCATPALPLKATAPPGPCPRTAPQRARGRRDWRAHGVWPRAHHRPHRQGDRHREQPARGVPGELGLTSWPGLVGRAPGLVQVGCAARPEVRECGRVPGSSASVRA